MNIATSTRNDMVSNQSFPALDEFNPLDFLKHSLPSIDAQSGASIFSTPVTDTSSIIGKEAGTSASHTFVVSATLITNPIEWIKKDLYSKKHIGIDININIEERSRQNKIYRQEALEELKDIDDESREEGFELCSPEAKELAEKLFQHIFDKYPLPYTIYPTADREVAIYTAGKPGHAVLILCESNGGVACLVNEADKNSHAHYDKASEHPNTFVLDALHNLKN